ncbi:MAG: regulatory protein RecX [Spirochaetota bacterium]
MGDLYKEILKYIKIRARSSGEVKLFLKERGVLPNNIDQYIIKLEEDALLNDSKFCENRIYYRLQGKHWGKLRIQTELLLLGVEKSLIQSELDKIPLDLWQESCTKLIRKKKFDKKIPTDILKLKKKLLAGGHEESIIQKAFADLEIPSPQYIEQI